MFSTQFCGVHFNSLNFNNFVRNIRSKRLEKRFWLSISITIIPLLQNDFNPYVVCFTRDRFVWVNRGGDKGSSF